MLTHSVFPYYHPSTIVIVDDNELFLRALEVDLPTTHNFKLEHDPYEALETLNTRVDTTPLAERCFRPIESEYNPAFHIDMELIQNEITLLDRFRHISVAVIDYSMPSLNGIDLCAQINDPYMKKMLITGVADEEVAVAAFNDGLIDRFVTKQDALELGAILEYVEDLETRYFYGLQDRLKFSLQASRPSFYDNLDFVDLFGDLRVEHDLVEYYVANDPPGFVLLNPDGKAFRLVTASAAELQEQAAYVERHGGPADIVAGLRNRKILGYFYERIETFYDKSEYDWNDYVLPARPIDEQWVCGLSLDPPTDVDFDPSKSSYRCFRATLPGPRFVALDDEYY